MAGCQEGARHQELRERRSAMKALVPTGRPGALVALAEVGMPSPMPGEALVKVTAFSVNRGEIFRLEDPLPGTRPGKDIAGQVVQAAADGSGPAAGQQVVGHPEHGGWAEYAAVPADSLAVLPGSVPAVEAAALPLAGLTALRLLRAAGNVTGQRILLTGASGGVGHYLTELAAHSGAEVTALTASAERGQRLAALGAAAVIHDLASADGPFCTVLESTGGEALARAMGLLARGGTLIWFGQASRSPATLSFFDILSGPQSATIRTFAYWDSPVSYGQDLATLVRLVATGRLHPEIGRLADWEHTAATLIDLYQRRIRGNAVLTIS
jgi:NADPH:quinone reductase-like Zn-dependent oxidoreductase